MYNPSRGGVRGGADQFSWESVKNDKHRENYLGHSLKAPVGRWQKGKDLSWYAKERKDGDAVEKAEKSELAAIKKAEEEAMLIALGHNIVRKETQALSKEEIREALRRNVGDRDDHNVERIDGVGASSQRRALLANIPQDSRQMKEGVSFEGYKNKDNNAKDNDQEGKRNDPGHERKHKKKKSKKHKKEKHKKELSDSDKEDLYKYKSKQKLTESDDEKRKSSSKLRNHKKSKRKKKDYSDDSSESEDNSSCRTKMDKSKRHHSPEESVNADTDKEKCSKSIYSNQHKEYSSSEQSESDKRTSRNKNDKKTKHRHRSSSLEKETKKHKLYSDKKKSDVPDVKRRRHDTSESE